MLQVLVNRASIGLTVMPLADQKLLDDGRPYGISRLTGPADAYIRLLREYRRLLNMLPMPKRRRPKKTGGPAAADFPPKDYIDANGNRPAEDQEYEPIVDYGPPGQTRPPISRFESY